MRRTFTALFAAYVPHGASTAADMAANTHTVTANFRQTEAAATQSDLDKEQRGFFYLPRLDYDIGVGIPPLMSKKQFDVQYHVFHKDAVERLNKHTLGSELEGHTLDVVIRKTAFDASQAVTHAAASEHFNYCFWYRSLRPWGTAVPQALRNELQLQYSRNGTLDAVEELKRQMMVTAMSQQAMTGWVYLVWTGKAFDIVEFNHGACPIGSDLTPLMAINMHHSALHFDYSVQPDEETVRRYVTNYFKTCNWTVAEQYFLKAIEKE